VAYLTLTLRPMGPVLRTRQSKSVVWPFNQGVIFFCLPVSRICCGTRARRHRCFGASFVFKPIPIYRSRGIYGPCSGRVALDMAHASTLVLKRAHRCVAGAWPSYRHAADPLALGAL